MGELLRDIVIPWPPSERFGDGEHGGGGGMARYADDVVGGCARERGYGDLGGQSQSRGRDTSCKWTSK